MIIHIFDETPHHYKPMQSFFSKTCQVEPAQFYWVKKTQHTSAKANNTAEPFTYYENNDQLFTYLAQLPVNAKVIFHGLFDIHTWRRLLLHPIVKRCSCVIWGTELYRHRKPNRSWKDFVALWLHQRLISRFANVFALTPGDAELVTRYLKRKDVKVLAYPLIGLVREQHKQVTYSAAQPLRILVGNSADKSNEHLQVLSQLAHLADANVEVVMPLNYAGNDEYINAVVCEGKRLFADKFVAITDMLEKSAYDQLLSTVDITVFAHQRQQGLYVVYAMLEMGKTIFLRRSTSSYSNLSALGFDVKAFEGLNEFNVEELKALVKSPNTNNQALMAEHYTEQALAPKWSKMVNAL
ncbi:TDP-N-acetylfucosamine:lipid II N-acetylfucosaminyltransferase [Cognaticolwellia mytili]|uniref:TDP-N-acetylfucosamine:lipid II N-acetylfucosaminyltransferase n=1 Tax=Cognaticolwellia mytili TaxID=1888913 RepID=UPI000A175279|nr:TDP-N-acetylfucosamine:lipid II N-acetylfucosaminyltransferase [Cognaticolwellia mytili]